ncbi:MAG: PLP-dependent transferase [Actinomycetota bacterium]|nr:PLP-dependent transferase [Actinomycetota bacterium]
MAQHPANDRSFGTGTTVVVAGRGREQPGDPMNVPITLASTLLGGHPAEPGGEPLYSRNDGLDSWVAFEEVVGGLESGEAVAFSSGMAAASAVFDQLPAGATIAAPADVYGGVATFLADGAARLGWEVRRVGNTDTAGWFAAVEGAALVWLESPSNPLLEVTELEPVIAAAKRAGALAAVDNTFASPLVQRPLELGADVVVHSATKLIGGHSDLLAGIAVAADEALVAGLQRQRALHGATPGALEMFLALRGVRTLAVRFERAQHNARHLAAVLDAHPNVTTVRYAGRRPGGDAGYGTIISFDVEGTAADADEMIGRLELVRHATSLGGVESTIERRSRLAGQEHLPPSLLRMSVGIEDVGDLVADLTAALDSRAAPAR